MPASTGLEQMILGPVAVEAPWGNIWTIYVDLEQPSLGRKHAGTWCPCFGAQARGTCFLKRSLGARLPIS